MTKNSGTGTAAPAVAYYRVSTRQQGESRLGLDAQKVTVEAFCKSRGLVVARSFEDIETGKHNNRPGLAAAIQASKEMGAKLLIAKLDRLSRDVEFIWHLRNTGVDFVAIDLPEANTLTISIMAALAQHERELISGRTRAALAVLKMRGKKLGSPRNLTDRVRAKGRAARTAKSLQHSGGAAVTALALRSEGWGLARIAETLNEAGHRTPRNREYTPTAVWRILKARKG